MSTKQTSSTKQYYKYHKKYNDQQHLFDSSLFNYSDLVLIRTCNGINRLYFVREKHEVGTENGEPVYDGIIGSFELPKTFILPCHAEKISADRFFQLTGSK